MIVDQLTSFVPKLCDAIENPQDQAFYAEWCRNFITDLAAVCLPGQVLEIRTPTDPQEEESKKEKLSEQIFSEVTKFCQFIDGQQLSIAKRLELTDRLVKELTFVCLLPKLKAPIISKTQSTPKTTF